MTTRHTTTQGARENTCREAQVLDEQTFRQLLAEGQELRRAFNSETARMRVITPDDMKTRSR